MCGCVGVRGWVAVGGWMGVGGNVAMSSHSTPVFLRAPAARTTQSVGFLQEQQKKKAGTQAPDSPTRGQTFSCESTTPPRPLEVVPVRLLAALSASTVPRISFCASDRARFAAAGAAAATAAALSAASVANVAANTRAAFIIIPLANVNVSSKTFTETHPPNTELGAH